MENGDNEQDAAGSDAARSKVLFAEVVYSDCEQYEYGDVEAHAMDADTSDFSPRQFIDPDEAHDLMIIDMSREYLVAVVFQACCRGLQTTE